MKRTLLALILCSSIAHADELAGILSPLIPHVLPPASDASSRGSAAAVRADSRGTLIGEAEVLAALQQQLASDLGITGDLRLSFARPFTAVRSPGAQWSVSIQKTPAGGLAASMLVGFRIECEGKTVADFQQILRAQLWKPVWVSTRRLDRGQSIDPTLCSTQTLDVLRERQALVPGDTDLANYEMAQTVSQERPLAWRDIAPKPLVRKGQVVDVVAAEGALSISMKAVALANGAQGEAITVRNLDSRKDFNARVSGANTVQVAF